jgi:hypothetical protein
MIGRRMTRRAAPATSWPPRLPHPAWFLAAAFVFSSARPVAAQNGGPLESASFTVPAFTINSGGTPYRGQTSASFTASGCFGEVGSDLHSSSSFQLLAGFCARDRWLIEDRTTVAAHFPELIVRTSLAPAAPNPADGLVRFGFSVGAGETASLRLYDVAGRLVSVLADDIKGPVGRIMSWDLTDAGGRRVAAGVYFARLETGETSRARQVVVLAP